MAAASILPCTDGFLVHVLPAPSHSVLPPLPGPGHFLMISVSVSLSETVVTIWSKLVRFQAHS